MKTSLLLILIISSNFIFSQNYLELQKIDGRRTVKIKENKRANFFLSEGQSYYGRVKKIDNDSLYLIMKYKKIETEKSIAINNIVVIEKRTGKMITIDIGLICVYSTTLSLLGVVLFPDSEYGGGVFIGLIALNPFGIPWEEKFEIGKKYELKTKIPIL
jgi:hypothetical protein